MLFFTLEKFFVHQQKHLLVFSILLDFSLFESKAAIVVCIPFQKLNIETSIEKLRLKFFIVKVRRRKCKSETEKLCR